MVTPPPRRWDPADPEDDPTGMRALLSALPDPGPMPAHLVDRITASLAAEQAARQHAVTSLAQRRKVRRGLGLAAAAAVVVALGGTALMTGTGPGAVTALFTHTGSDSAGSSPASGAAESASRGADPSAPKGLSDRTDPGPAVAHQSGTAYRSASLAAQAAAFLAHPGAPLRPLGAEPPSIGPIGTENGLRSCLGALGLPSATGVTADVATLDGRPAALLVVRHGAGHAAYAVGRDCTAGHPALLAGPVTMP